MAVGAVGLIVLYIGSFWRGVGIVAGPGMVSVQDGPRDRGVPWNAMVSVSNGVLGFRTSRPDAGALRVATLSRPAQEVFWPVVRIGGERAPTTVVLWPLCVGMVIAGAVSMRGARVSACGRCGYDRRGLASGAVCPECGAAWGAKAGVH